MLKKPNIRDIGILPLLVSLPFMYYPKALSGDTQPWILIAALIAFLTFRTERLFKLKDVVLFILVFFCIFVYFLRVESNYLLLRYIYIFIAFFVFWVVCQREDNDYFPAAIKFTVVIWFLVGLYQYISIKMGYDIQISGRYLPGRMGPPSLTAEASYYGSISMIHLMYLLSEKGSKNTIYIILCVSSVLLSGSLLAMVLLIFPLLRLPLKYQLTILLFLPIFILIDYFMTSSGVVSRLVNIFSNGFTLSGLLKDASLNLRAGHIYYVFIENLFPTLFLVSPVNFMNEYNIFAVKTDFIIPTGSDYILPALGELVYGSGFLAFIILFFIFKKATQTCTSFKEKLEKIGFIIACLLNPISISNIFLIMYIMKRP